MKRLVVCCDGTWNAPNSAHVSNIEKIALAVDTRTPVPRRPKVSDDLGHEGAWDGETIQQSVHYIAGVGSHGYLADRLLGGAFGYGLATNVTEAYRVLCLNFDEGDEIFLFGFSRGAYTARSVAGMISTVGLLRSDALLTHRDGNRLAEAETLYRDCDDDCERRRGEFRRSYCHAEVSIAFLGVFDTVGALGVPGPSRERTKFHDVRLGGTVRHARQALAIDERRMTFEPCVWTIDSGASAAERPETIEQVWFEGAHSDVGGGYSDSGLSDTTLRWMVGEAERQGLWFTDDAIDTQIGAAGARKHAVCHDSMSTAYRVVNTGKRFAAPFASLARRLRPAEGKKPPRFRGARRLLYVDAKTSGGDEYVSLASTAATDWAAPGPYRTHAVNIGWWARAVRQVPRTEVEPYPCADRTLRVG